MRMKKIFSTQNLIRFIFITFIGSSIYAIVELVMAPTVAPLPDIGIRVKRDYVFVILQCLLGALAMLLPGILRHRVRLDIPNPMIIAYAVFIYCGIYLAEVRSFYYVIPHFDTILHTFSGLALGALGFSIVSVLNKSNTTVFSLSPVFVAIFAFCFALALGAIWEIFEFILDVFLGTNTQSYASLDGTILIGQAALADTMKDLIVDALGALFISIVGYISLKYKKGWLNRFHIRQMTEKQVKAQKE